MKRGVRRTKVSEKDLEQSFLTHFTVLKTDATIPVRQWKFHKSRKWKLDFAWPTLKVGIEIQGGIFIGGGHTRGLGYHKDCDKANAAAELGWLILRYTVLHVEDDPAAMVEQIERILRQRIKEYGNGAINFPDNGG